MVAPSSLPPCTLPDRSIPVLLKTCHILGEVLRQKSKRELKALCGVSDNLSSHVKGLYDSFVLSCDDTVSACNPARFNQAAVMFNGPAFLGLNAASLSAKQAHNLQSHLRILTGLYGPVKPADLIQEHRLCMSTKLVVGDHKDLYSFWGDNIANAIIDDINSQPGGCAHPLLINCASQEYFRAISGIESLWNTSTSNDTKKGNKGGSKPGKNTLTVVECVFLDGGTIKSAYAKRARGLMARFVCTHPKGIRSALDVDKIKEFDLEGYKFSPKRSSEGRLVFERSSPPPPPRTAAADSAEQQAGRYLNGTCVTSSSKTIAKGPVGSRAAPLKRKRKCNQVSNTAAPVEVISGIADDEAAQGATTARDASTRHGLSYSKAPRVTASSTTAATAVRPQHTNNGTKCSGKSKMFTSRSTRSSKSMTAEAVGGIGGGADIKQSTA